MIFKGIKDNYDRRKNKIGKKKRRKGEKENHRQPAYGGDSDISIIIIARQVLNQQEHFW